MSKLLLVAVALLLAVSSGKADPITGSVVIVGTNSSSLYNTPQLLLGPSSLNRNWAEIVNNTGTNYLYIDDKYPVWVTNLINGVTYINWSGTILFPGGSYVIRPFGSQKANAGAWGIYGVVQGIGTNSVGTREQR